MEYTTFGKHLVVDLWGVSFELLNDINHLEYLLTQAAMKSGATIISIQRKQFQPQGVTILIMLAESHLSIHTYPEQGFAAVDCYTCGYRTEPEKAIQYLIECLQPEQIKSKSLQRG